MADRAAKRMRRMSSDYDDSVEADDMEGYSEFDSATPQPPTSRPRRGAANQPPAAVIDRSSPAETRQSMHLTVKASPNKLRKATGGRVQKTALSSRNTAQGKRASRASRVVREYDSDDDDEEEEEEADAMDLDDVEEDEDVDAEGEDDDDPDAEGEEDDDMDDVALLPQIVVTNNQAARKASGSGKPQDAVEAKEMSMLDDDDDDEELSELESEEEMQDEDAEGEDEDAEGDEDDDIPVQDEDEEDEDVDSDEMDASMMQDSKDPSKLTRRQRAAFYDEGDGGLMALSNEAQKKKHLTAEEHAMRRAEMARRRKNLSEKRNEEEKMDTINRLLKKQPPKRGRKIAQDDIASGNEDDQEPEKPNPLYTRYIQNANGTKLGVPEEWLQAPVGRPFAGNVAKPSHRPYGGRLVEEVA